MDKPILEYNNDGLFQRQNAGRGNDEQLENLLNLYDKINGEEGFVVKRIFSDGKMLYSDKGKSRYCDLIRIEKELLQKQLGDKKAVICGIEEEAQLYYESIKRHGLKDRIKTFVVVFINKEMPKRLFHIPVRNYTDYIDTEIGYIIAVSDEYRDLVRISWLTCKKYIINGRYSFKMKKRLIERKAVEAMGICLLPVLLYGIIGPLEIYVGNPLEFEFILKDFFLPFLMISGAFWMAASAVLIILPDKLSSILKVFIFTFSIMSYLQNMFLNSKLMNEDGSPMDWVGGGMQRTKSVNLIIWIIIVTVCFVIPFILKDKYKKLYFGISSFLSAIQIVAIISLVIQAGSIKYDGCQILFSGENQFKMAQDENIIIIVLDSYHNMQFEETMAQNPDIAVALKDFTYYNNADAHYYSTYPSLAHMLTGKEFDYSISEEDWIEDCWQQPSCEALYDAFHNEGYVCDLYYNDLLRNIGTNNIEDLKDKIDNIIETKPRIRLGLLVSIMEKMTIYKYMPYILKPYFEVNSQIVQEIAVYDNMESKIANFYFYEELMNQKLSIDETVDRKLSFNHLYGLHKPWDTDSNGHKTEEYVTVGETSEGLCVIIMEYIEQLKEIGAYDNATIIITADHGLGITMPQPLFLIKIPHASQDELRITSAPISHDDFLPTLLDLLGEDYSSYGTSIYDWEEGDHRTRSLWIPGEGGYLIYTYDTDRYELINQTKEDAVLVINPTQ